MTHFTIGTLQSGMHMYSKTCLKQPLKIDKTKVLTTNGSLMHGKVLQNAILEHSAILLTCVNR